MDFRRHDTNHTRPLSSITLDPSSSFVPNRKSHTRPSSSGSGSHCRLSRRPRSSIDLFRSRMEERRFSAPPDSTTPPPRRPRSSSRARPTSFLDMSEPSRFSLSGVKLLSSTSMEGIKAGKRKVSLEVKIPDGMSSTESFGHINMARTGSTTVGRTLNSLFLRAKRASQESGPSSPPDLFSGESAHSDSSLPPTPRTGTFAPNDLSGTGLVEDESKTEVTEEEKERKEIMRIRNQFDYRRQGIPHHKFPKHEVPYMQSYSHVSLHNDYHTTDLLQHLTPNNSPTFHDFGDNPPFNVLDLGGGEGYWAAEAAAFWKAAGTTVTVYDIVDLGRPVKKAIDPELYHRVIFQQGNFLKSVSQIPPKSFDLVRMANLTLAIPKNRWPHLLKEVKRILRPGGVVEIIDDELFFPSIQPGPAPTLKHCKSMAGRRKPKLDLVDRSADDTALKPTQPLPPRYTKDGSPRGCRESLNDANDPAGEYRQRSITTRTMETIFQNMLQYEYGLSLQPHEFLEHEMLKVFDGVTVETKEVSVPKRDLSMKSSDIGTPTSDSTKLRKSRNSLEDAVLTDFSRPAFVAPKAAKLLQLDAGIAGPAPYQPSGYIISPDTFVPCEPDVLEMHALRNVHILLSCKIALKRWFDRHRDENGEPELMEDEFEELISDYEDFKRRRMNWPRYYLGVGFEEEPQSPTLSPKPLFGRRETAPRNRDSSIETTTIVSVPKEALIPVRRFRVYVGHKSDPRAMHTR